MPQAKDTEYGNRFSTVAERTEHQDRTAVAEKTEFANEKTEFANEKTEYQDNTATAEKAEYADEKTEDKTQYPAENRDNSYLAANQHMVKFADELRGINEQAALRFDRRKEPGGVRPEGKGGDAGGGDGSLQRGQLREFPRLPLYRDFHRWAEMGQRLLDLHIGFESAEPYLLERHERAGVDPKRAILRADKSSGTITLDERTTLRVRAREGMGVPAGEPLRPGVAAGPVQGEETPGPDHPGEVQQLPLFRPQGAGHRPAAAGLHRQRGHHGDSGQHGPPGAGGTARALPLATGSEILPQCRRMKAQKDRTKCCVLIGSGPA